ncbi:COG1470 family protein [Yinghuangia sp. YIM S09857]|uniref:COG1470 family protein n=1 Tax=Yinghuangia sp. YIM S09857 TaxID=3436929 RepID=UPI003F5370D0
MSATATLDTPAVSVEPGGTADVPLQIRNSGSTVEEYRFEVTGPCARWMTVEPERVSLYPETAETVTVRLRPPRESGIRAGEAPYGIRVVPTNEPDRAVVPEGTVTVLPFTEVTAELLPRASHAARKGKHRIAVDNRGNTPVTTKMLAQPGSRRVEPRFAKDELVVAPGHAGFTEVSVRPAKLIWFGPPQTHNFQIAVATSQGTATATPAVDAAAAGAKPGDPSAPSPAASAPEAAPAASSAPPDTAPPPSGTPAPAPLASPVPAPVPAPRTPESTGPAPAQPPVLLDGTFEQRALMPRWLPRAVVALVVIAGILVGLWYSVLRPTVRSAARDTVPGEVEKVLNPEGGGTTGPNGLGDGLGNTGPNGSGGNQPTGRPGEQPGGQQPGGPGTQPGAPGGPGGTSPGATQNPAASAKPTSARLEVSDAVGGSTSSQAYEVPAGQTLELTDLVVQNPQGDAGTLVIANQDRPILSLALENFRDLDYHFVTPVVVTEGASLTMTVNCAQVGRPVAAPPPAGCVESLLLGGVLRPTTS